MLEPSVSKYPVVHVCCPVSCHKPAFDTHKNIKSFEDYDHRNTPPFFELLHLIGARRNFLPKVDLENDTTLPIEESTRHVENESEGGPFIGYDTDSEDEDENDDESADEEEDLDTEQFCVFCGRTLPDKYTMEKHLSFCFKTNYR